MIIGYVYTGKWLDCCIEKAYNNSVKIIFNLTSALFEGNRESGENPERSGHCDGGFIRNMSLGESLRRRGMEVMPESGNLLGKSLVNSFRRRHESKRILIICKTEYLLLLLPSKSYFITLKLIRLNVKNLSFCGKRGNR